MNEKSVFLKDCKSFTPVSNTLIRSKLSITAIGLMTKLLSYKDFAVHKDTERKKSAIGEKTFNKAWAELEKNGFIKRERVGTGKFVYRWIIINDPTLLNEQPKQKEKLKKTKQTHEGKNHDMDNQAQNITPDNPGVKIQEWNTSGGNGVTNIDVINLKESNEDKSNEDVKNVEVSTIQETIEEVSNPDLDYDIIVEVDDLPFGWDDD